MANIITRRKFLKDSALATGALVTASGLLVPRSAYAVDTPGTAPPVHFYMGASSGETNEHLMDVNYQAPGKNIIHRQVSPVGTPALPNYTGTIYNTLQDAAGFWNYQSRSPNEHLWLHITPKDGGWDEEIMFAHGDGAATRVGYIIHGQDSVPTSLDGSGNLPAPVLSGRGVFTKRIILENDSLVWNVLGRNEAGVGAPPISINGSGNYVGFCYSHYDALGTFGQRSVDIGQNADTGNLVEGSCIKLINGNSESGNIMVFRKAGTPYYPYNGKLRASNCVIHGNNLATYITDNAGSVDFGSTEYPGENIFTNTPWYLELIEPPPVRPGVKAGTDLVSQLVTFYEVNQFQDGINPITNVDSVLARIKITSTSGDSMTALDLRNQQASAKVGVPVEDYLKVSLTTDAPFPNRNQKAPTAARHSHLYSQRKDLEERTKWANAHGGKSRRDFLAMFNPGYSRRA